MNLRFQAKFLPLLAPFMARDDIRYYLNGISVRPWGEGVLIAATDGHTLALAYDRQGTADREVILRVSPGLLAACRRPPREWRRLASTMWVIAEDIPGTATEAREEIGATGPVKIPARPAKFRLMVHATDKLNPTTEVFMQAGDAEVDGKFPDVTRVVPKREDLKPGAPYAYQVEYIKRLPSIKVHRWGSSVRFYSVPDVPEGEGAPRGASVLVCHLPAEPDFMALIMPMRDDWQGDALPQWWTEELDRRNAPPAAA